MSHRGDAYEREADRVAEQVLRMRDPGPRAISGASLRLQSKCATCSDGDEACAEGAVEQDPEVRQRKADRPPEATDGVAPASSGADALAGPALETPVGTRDRVRRVMAQAGGSLDADIRDDMESRFRRDFRHVRIHTGPQAGEAARSIGARAFTLGHQIVFGAGQYTPATSSGQRLLAHELTHVLQQRPTTVFRDEEGAGQAPPDETQSGGQFWNCTSDRAGIGDPIAVVREAIRLAITMVDDALGLVDDASAVALLRREFCSANRRGTCPSRLERSRIRSVYTGIRSWLNGTPRFVCLSEDAPGCRRYTAAAICDRRSAPVRLCPSFFSEAPACNARNGNEARAAVVVHEAAHLMGVCSGGGESERGREIYCREAAYPPRTAAQDTADSYSEFATAALIETGSRRLRTDVEAHGEERPIYAPPGLTE